MFFPGSRYQNLITYPLTRANGTVVAVTRLPLPAQTPLLGYHQRRQGQRLDLIAAHYLVDPTTFWKLCDANNAVVPDALAVHDLIGIPATAQVPGQ
jgi:hypothetical protein